MKWQLSEFKISGNGSGKNLEKMLTAGKDTC